MTVVAAIIFGVLSGVFVRGGRKAALFVVPPYLVVLAFQTWLLASGRGNNPASTVREGGYWVVQVVALAVGVGLALGVAAIRARRRHAAGRTVTSAR